MFPKVTFWFKINRGTVSSLTAKKVLTFAKCEGSGLFYCKYINNKEKLRIEANLKETG